ncbi:MAG: hypothetical protein JNK04_17420 [Myxococcales bacterium]|nr:hypothetical protein [Myxococcales bacterium]
MRAVVLGGVLVLAGCESESPAAASGAPWVPEALTREHPILSAPPSASVSAPPPPGFLTLESKSLGWPAGTRMEVGVAFAHLLEEWPTPRGGLPRLVFERIELYAAGTTGASCTTSGTAPAGQVTPTAIVLEGKRRVDLEWEKDFAIGDDFELCVLGAPRGKAGSKLECPGLDLGRPNVIVSVSRDRIGGRLSLKSDVASVSGRFSAVVCPLPPLE